jgi:hypothetical protein
VTVLAARVQREKKTFDALVTKILEAAAGQGDELRAPAGEERATTQPRG